MNFLKCLEFRTTVHEFHKTQFMDETFCYWKVQAVLQIFNLECASNGNFLIFFVNKTLVILLNTPIVYDNISVAKHV